LRRAKTENSTSLGAVLNALTTCASGILAASASAPEIVVPSTRRVSSSLIGKVHDTIVFPDKLPACATTSCTRDQCTASSTTSAFATASAGVPARALAPAASASFCSFFSSCE